MQKSLLSPIRIWCIFPILCYFSCTPYIIMPPAVPVPTPDNGRELQVEARAAVRNLYDSKNGLKNLMLSATYKKNYHAFVHWNHFKDGFDAFIPVIGGVKEGAPRYGASNNQKMWMMGLGYSKEIPNTEYRVGLLGGAGFGSTVFDYIVDQRLYEIFSYHLKATTQSLFLIPFVSMNLKENGQFYFSSRFRTIRLKSDYFTAGSYNGRYHNGKPLVGQDETLYYPLPDFFVADSRTFFQWDPTITFRKQWSWVYMQIQVMKTFNIGFYPVITKPYRIELSVGLQLPGAKSEKKK
ncbi:MAG TPA: hypothetical protein PK509_09975 [Catalimonadaceae bacterium]|nr:hypothetical protein [Catalimonadaceae bacterium]